jgi:hypothetical protein
MSSDRHENRHIARVLNGIRDRLVACRVSFGATSGETHHTVRSYGLADAGRRF